MSSYCPLNQCGLSFCEVFKCSSFYMTMYVNKIQSILKIHVYYNKVYNCANYYYSSLFFLFSVHLIVFNKFLAKISSCFHEIVNEARPLSGFFFLPRMQMVLQKYIYNHIKLLKHNSFDIFGSQAEFPTYSIPKLNKITGNLCKKLLSFFMIIK